MTLKRNFEKMIVREYLKEAIKEKDNAVIDTYLTFRHEEISYLTLFDNGVNKGVCYSIDDFVLTTEKDLFAYALNDNEFLEMIANECEDAIQEWLNK